MSEETIVQRTTVAKNNAGQEKGGDHPIMSYTAVTSHQAMAKAFLKELLIVGQNMLPDCKLTVDELLSICHVALDKREHGSVVLEGRHMRGRIAEQLSRTSRYQEPFSILVLKLDGTVQTSVYDTIVDTLCERMRETDSMFLFKSRLVLLLPHTDQQAGEILLQRIHTLLNNSVGSALKDSQYRIEILSYPDSETITASQVLDWAEDQLRG